MNDMCEENTTQAMDLIDSEAVIWGIVTSPLHFAYEHFLYDVLAHMCSQKYINKRWYNNLSPNLGQFLKVIRIYLLDNDLNKRKYALLKTLKNTLIKIFILDLLIIISIKVCLFKKSYLLNQ